MAQVSNVLRSFVGGFLHWCPGCKGMHAIHVDRPNHSGARWSFSGTVDRPTFSPSINIRIGPDPEAEDGKPAGHFDVCHYFIRAGRIEFCSDSTHALAGQTVPMPELPNMR